MTLIRKLIGLPGSRKCSKLFCQRKISGNKQYCLAHTPEGHSNERPRQYITVPGPMIVE